MSPPFINMFMIKFSIGAFILQYLIKEIERIYINLWSNTFFSDLDIPTEQIGGRVARQRCPKFDLSAINASSTKEYPAESGAIEVAEFLSVDGSPENRRYCIVVKQKNLIRFSMVTVQDVAIR